MVILQVVALTQLAFRWKELLRSSSVVVRPPQLKADRLQRWFSILFDRMVKNILLSEFVHSIGWLQCRTGYFWNVYEELEASLIDLEFLIKSRRSG